MIATLSLSRMITPNHVVTDHPMPTAGAQSIGWRLTSYPRRGT
jgi:hypothetical protein